MKLSDLIPFYVNEMLLLNKVLGEYMLFYFDVFFDIPLKGKFHFLISLLYFPHCKSNNKIQFCLKSAFASDHGDLNVAMCTTKS